jgi:hypothetical protein
MGAEAEGHENNHRHLCDLCASAVQTNYFASFITAPWVAELTQ